MIWILLVCLLVSIIFALIPILTASSDLGISVPRFIKDFVKEMFNDTTCLEKIGNGFLVVCAIPSFISAIIFWACKCGLIYILELIKSHGGKYYD